MILACDFGCLLRQCVTIKATCQNLYKKHWLVPYQKSQFLVRNCSNLGAMLRGNWQKYFQRSLLCVRLSQIEDQKNLCKAKGLQGLLVVTLSIILSICFSCFS
jgi:hypothetical protein